MGVEHLPEVEATRAGGSALRGEEPRIGVVVSGSPRAIWGAFAAGAEFAVVDAPAGDAPEAIRGWMDEACVLARLIMARCQGLRVG